MCLRFCSVSLEEHTQRFVGTNLDSSPGFDITIVVWRRSTQVANVACFFAAMLSLATTLSKQPFNMRAGIRISRPDVAFELSSSAAVLDCLEQT